MYGDSKNPMTQEMAEASMVNAHDEHYAKMAIEPLAVMRGLLTREEFIGFLKGNIIKYSMRQGLKAGEPAQKDADKARTYISFLKMELNND